MKTLTTLFCISFALLTSGVFAQKPLRGRVADENGSPLTGANVYIRGTYSGTITDEEGYFSFNSTSPIDSMLVISFIGYERREIPIRSISEEMEITLEEENSEVNEIIIMAGAFEAGEEKRAVMLNPVDIATTASSDGDVYGALATFPGAQKQGESGELIVRGGEAHETKTYIDGMMVSSPYGSSMPDLPVRGRFAPFMFNGVMFSTGGYSAEYGQALSSVIELQTPGIFDEDVTSISLMNVGAGISHTRRNTRSGISAEANYINTWPYFAMATHDLNWTRIPQDVDGKFYYRQKIGKTGLLKTDAIASYSVSELDYSDLEGDYQNVRLKNNNQLIKSSYNSEVGDNWIMKTGIAYNRNSDRTLLDQDGLHEDLSSLHVKASMVNYYSDNITIRTGGDASYLDYRFKFHVDSSGQDYEMLVKDWIFAGYLESDIRLHKKIALRVGGRSEYSTYSSQNRVAPRLSLAFQLTGHAQLSAAWGIFYQQGSHDYLKYSNELKFEEAMHVLLNYQYQKNDRLFRAELFLKKYDKLICYTRGEYAEFENLTNGGDGCAQGIDIFWKDDRTLRHGTYWISYSYVDSKRQYRDYPERVEPHFVAPHNLSFVAKYYWHPLRTQFAATYTFSSGRTYFNPNSTEFMGDRTPAIHDLSANASYITNLFGYFAVVHLSVSNLLGTEHIYSYRFSGQPDEKGSFEASPVTNLVRRTIIIGVFISLE